MLVSENLNNLASEEYSTDLAVSDIHQVSTLSVSAETNTTVLQ